MRAPFRVGRVACLAVVLATTGCGLSEGRSATDTPELYGTWTGWGRVTLADGSGTYSDTYGQPGWLKFRRVEEGTYEGTWGEGEGKRRYGHLRFSLSADGTRIEGSWGAADDCDINPGSPASDSLTWRRVEAESGG